MRCYSDRDQNTGAPFTSKQLKECYRKGAELFGWSKRNSAPRSMRDGTDLVGWGMATGVWEALQMPMGARIVLSGNGHAEVSCATSDIGTGTYTVMAQVAADMLGVPIDNVTVKLGDSTLPHAMVEGGSWTAASVSHAIAVTADEVRKELLGLAQTMPNSPLAGLQAEDVVLADGMIAARQDCRAERYRSRRPCSTAGVDRIVHERSAEFPEDTKHARNTHSAIFAEVKVDEAAWCHPRDTRCQRGCRRAHHQYEDRRQSGHGERRMGHRHGSPRGRRFIDHSFGRIMNANIAEYHVPVNADVQDIKVIFVDEPDNIVNPLGIKGVGEIGIVGVAAAIANAVYHATGKRVRDLPITIDKVLG